MAFNVCNIGKLICYTRRLSTIQGVCLEGFIVTYTLSDNFHYNRCIELYNVKNYRYTQGKNYNCNWLWENLSLTDKDTNLVRLLKV